MQYKRFTHQSEPEKRISGRCLILPPGPFFANKLHWIFKQYVLMITPQKGLIGRQAGCKTRVRRNNPPAARVIPRKFYLLTFVKRTGETFMAADDAFLTPIDFI
ncbi:hypothetical protein FTO33_05315 [Klebsiella pneumoniae]|uniref:Uncharacterized protein n=1 Tax=Klebsiella pneumoniae TaxID=573 RepID=A0AAW9UU90_KLEPN|nr:hypothetical protein C0076_09165 [Klebsiella pneumoniae]OWU97272.1 hypothetical protein B5K12_06735 [Klebsiella pneumoniae subsp. pneumoniae]TYC81944.1 hypothetical protein E4M18_008170 [Klebsiella sp. Z2]AUN77165.1 hypothetical protein C0080_08685 [Klebsiella pneumoniae]KAB0298278.1 hypothetical protein FPQ50_04135 [Klebsiella pneumoniae]